MHTTKVSETEISALSSAYPGLPSEYLAYLLAVGWGKTANGRMIYSGPVSPQDIYGNDLGCTDILLFGDDFAGYCFGYNFSASLYGELTPNGEWQAWPAGQGFRHYVGA